jgi:predicted GNAT family acetyltransferase
LISRQTKENISMSDSPGTAVNVVHEAGQRRFSAEVDGHHARVDYELEAPVMRITHTVVPDAIGGRGIAGRLVRAALDHARAQGWKVQAVCSYADAWIGRHPEYTDLRA